MIPSFVSMLSTIPLSPFEDIVTTSDLGYYRCIRANKCEKDTSDDEAVCVWLGVSMTTKLSA